MSVRPPVRQFVHPIVRSISFFGTGSLVFSKTQHGVRCPYLVICNRARFFFKKILIRQEGPEQKWSKMSQKTRFLIKIIRTFVLHQVQTKTNDLIFLKSPKFLDFLRKSSYQVFLELVQNECSYGLYLTLCKTCMPGKNPVLKFDQKWLWSNENLVFFNNQFLILIR